MRKWLQSELAQNISITLVVVLAYLFCRSSGLSVQKERIQMIMLVILTIGFIYLIWNKQTIEKNIWLIIILGMVLRMGYMLYTPCNVRSHDLWEIDVNGMGHAGYLLKLLERGRLPESNALQLYQQPFYYMVGALVSKGINGILGCGDSFYLVDAAKTVSCVASCISLVGCKRICEECNVYDKGQKSAIMLVAFLPAFYLTGGRVNPDALAGMFMIYALLYTIRWIKKPDWENTIILALLYGCGVMTKISCAVIALITAMVFFIILAGKIREGRGSEILGKYIVFGLISLPLGLWYGIRNHIKFGQPLTYVLPLDKTLSIYTGDHSLFQRFAGVDFFSLFRNPYVSLTEDYNAPVYYLKSAMFGEFSYDVSGWIPVLLLFCAAILSVWVVISCFWQANKNRSDRFGNLMLVSAIVFYCSILWFYCKYPFACSMDFRYMIFMVLPLSVLFGKYREKCSENGMWIDLALWGFMLGSCLHYCTI